MRYDSQCSLLQRKNVIVYVCKKISLIYFYLNGLWPIKRADNVCARKNFWITFRISFSTAELLFGWYDESSNKDVMSLDNSLQ